MDDDGIFRCEFHEWTKGKIGRLIAGPVRVAEQFPDGTRTARFNA